MVQINEPLLAELCRKHDVRVLKLFGSAARGEDTPASDIDLLVEFEGRKSLFDLMVWNWSSPSSWGGGWTS